MVLAAWEMISLEDLGDVQMMEDEVVLVDFEVCIVVRLKGVL